MWIHNLKTETIQFQELRRNSCRGAQTPLLSVEEDWGRHSPVSWGPPLSQISAFFRRRSIDSLEKEQPHLQGIPFYFLIHHSKALELRETWMAGRDHCYHLEWLFWGHCLSYSSWKYLCSQISARGGRNIKHTGCPYKERMHNLLSKRDLINCLVTFMCETTLYPTPRPTIVEDVVQRVLRYSCLKLYYVHGIDLIITRKIFTKLFCA